MAATAAVAPARHHRLGRLERPALTGVLVREVVNYSSYWRSLAFSSTVEPTIYLLTFGFGFGTLVSQVAGYDYVGLIGTRIVATAVLFSSAFPAIVRDVRQVLVPAHVRRSWPRSSTWRSSSLPRRLDLLPGRGYGCVPLLVAMAFGLDPSWGMLAVPFIAFVSGFGWAGFGISVAGFAKSFENFSYVVSAVLTPLFLVAGTFFPISELPEWAQVPAELQPALPLRGARPPCGLRLGSMGLSRARSSSSAGACSPGGSRSTQ